MFIWLSLNAITCFVCDMCAQSYPIKLIQRLYFKLDAIAGPTFILLKSGLELIQYISCKIIHISNNFIRIFYNRIYSLPMNLHKHQLYESFKKVGQQLLGLTLRVNYWLWNWARAFVQYNITVTDNT